MEFIKGPDFPTSAIVEGLDGIKRHLKKEKEKLLFEQKLKLLKKKT